MYKVNKLVSFFSPSRGQGSRDSLTQESFTLNKLPKVYTHTKKKKKKKRRKKTREVKVKSYSKSCRSYYG